VLLVLRNSLGTVFHGVFVIALPDEFARHVAKLAAEWREEFQHPELPDILGEIDGVDGAFKPGFRAFGVERQQHIRIRVGRHEFAPDAAGGIVNRS